MKSLAEVAIRSRYALSFADVLFGFLLVGILQQADQGMMDDPGLGWHLRIADAMWESGGFLRSEQFCYPTEGSPWITKSWLADITFRLAYAWGGMNGIAVITALILALMLRCLYTRLVGQGVPWLVAALWTWLAALGTSPAWVARPNVFTMLSLVLVCQICEQFHDGRLTAAKTLWLIPLFALWPNMHGGYLAGVVILAVTYLTECGLAALDPDVRGRRAARKRLVWLSILGVLVFFATLVNPNALRLHLWNLRILTDPFLQTRTTDEWLPPNFKAQGWFRIEMLILMFPALGVMSRRKMSLVGLALCVVWLHFALTAERYCPLWVIVATPWLAMLSCEVPYLKRLTAAFVNLWSEDVRRRMVDNSPRPGGIASLVMAIGLLLASPWLSDFAAHDSKNLPTRALDRFLDVYRGEKVFHSINWGGYLVWHGWNLNPRMRTFVDDRTDVHGTGHTMDYMAIMNADSGWQTSLSNHDVHLACLPLHSRLAKELEKSSGWVELYRDDVAVIFRRHQPGAALPK